MVSWGRAFKGALMIVLWSVIWIVVGLLVAGLGAGVIFLSVQQSALGQPSIGTLLGGIAAMVVGFLIVLLGVAAAWLKISAEITAEEVRLGGV